MPGAEPQAWETAHERLRRQAPRWRAPGGEEARPLAGAAERSPAEAVTRSKDRRASRRSNSPPDRFAILWRLQRGRLAAGETRRSTARQVLPNAGGTSARLGAADGEAGRDREALSAVAEAAGPRVQTVALSGDVAADAKAMRDAAGGGAHIAFDMVGNAADPRSTLAALTSLRRDGRLVLMGSMTVDLPIPYTQVMLNGGRFSLSSVQRTALGAMTRAQWEEPPRLARSGEV